MHFVTKSFLMYYLTELRVTKESNSISTLTALAWIIVRNTLALNLNILRSSRLHEKSGQKIAVEYVSVLGGNIGPLCSNDDQEGLAKSRYETISVVCRNVPSCSEALDNANITGIQNQQQRQHYANGDRAYVSSDPISQEKAKEDKKHLFHTSAGIRVVSSFMQWTGVLGARLNASPVAETIMDIFKIQLFLSKALLDPNMCSPGQHGRCLQVSKTRLLSFFRFWACLVFMACLSFMIVIPNNCFDQSCGPLQLNQQHTSRN